MHLVNSCKSLPQSPLRHLRDVDILDISKNLIKLALTETAGVGFFSASRFLRDDLFVNCIDLCRMFHMKMSRE